MMTNIIDYYIKMCLPPALPSTDTVPQLNCHRQTLSGLEELLSPTGKILNLGNSK